MQNVCIVSLNAYMIRPELVLDALDCSCNKRRRYDHQQQPSMLDNLSHVIACSQAIWCLVALHTQLVVCF